ncbi:hypothetical protein HN51_010900, partial [Arachis hypogaea]
QEGGHENCNKATNVAGVGVSHKIQHATNPNNIQQGPSDVAFTTQFNPALRLKNPVIRSPPPPTPNISSFMPTLPLAPRPTLWFKSQLPQGP